MSRFQPLTWLARWEAAVRRLADKTSKPMIAIVISEERSGLAAHTVHRATYGETEFAAKALLGDIIASITSDGYVPGACTGCDERLARAQAAYALLEPQTAEFLPGTSAKALPWGGKRELH